MALRVPSFFAAFSSAARPPKSAAEVAVAAFLPSAVVDALSGAAPQALRVRAARTPRAAVLGRDTVTASPGDVRGCRSQRERTCLNKLASVRPPLVSCR
jgi:hypothetical protein